MRRRQAVLRDRSGELALVAGALAGSEAAWRSMVEKYQRVISSRVFRLLVAYFDGYVDQAEVEDIVGDAWVKLLQDDRAYLRNFDPDRGPLGAWLGILAWRAVGNELSRRAAQRRGWGSTTVPLDYEEETGRLAERVPTAAPSAEDLVAAAERVALVPQLVATAAISEQQRLVVRLTLAGLERCEIVAQTGINGDCASSALHAATRRLRDECQRRAWS